MVADVCCHCYETGEPEEGGEGFDGQEDPFVVEAGEEARGYENVCEREPGPDYAEDDKVHGRRRAAAAGVVEGGDGVCIDAEDDDGEDAGGDADAEDGGEAHGGMYDVADAAGSSIEYRCYLSKK